MGSGSRSVGAGASRRSLAVGDLKLGRFGIWYLTFDEPFSSELLGLIGVPASSACRTAPALLCGESSSEFETSETFRDSEMLAVDGRPRCPRKRSPIRELSLRTRSPMRPPRNSFRLDAASDSLTGVSVSSAAPAMLLAHRRRLMLPVLSAVLCRRKDGRLAGTWRRPSGI